MVQASDEFMDDSCIAAFGGRDGREKSVCAVRHPVQPVEFAELWGAGADFDAGVDVVVRWHVFGEAELTAGDFGKGGFDDF